MEDLVCGALGILVALVTVVMFSEVNFPTYPGDKETRAKIIVALSLVVFALAGAAVLFV